ncbi:hypothetical protein AWM68_14385 [Fictibacillus phosphorivorans]|uniref:Uncharacterized protein n=1 Tax=Fictibacillus phosphorivorans TaxID=1221500 RepID=A0A165N1R4_9BACL|nr:endospore germination permease [Fictibacillus phosphorivorans]KZE64274.1 hypothetical protein AWM68_14385 [Fictibacillus phosphorivorans]
MKNKKIQISSFQTFFLVIQSQIGISVISLPYFVFLAAKTDSWISVLIAGFIVQLIILMNWALLKRFPERNVFEIIKHVLGNRLGKLVIVFYVAYFILVASVVLSLFSLAIKSWLLPLTPQWVIKLLMVLIGIYIAKENIRIISRFYVLASVVIFMFIVLMFYSFRFGNHYYLMPIGISGVTPILKGVKEAILPFIGFELFMVVYPNINATDGTKLKVFTLANFFVTSFYTLITLACLAFFSPDELTLIPQPVLYLIKSFSFRIIERPDIFFTSFWIVLVATSFMSYLYSLSRGLKSVYISFYRKWYVYLGGMISFTLSNIYNQKIEVSKLSNLTSVLSLVFIVILPFILFMLTMFLKKREDIKYA